MFAMIGSVITAASSASVLAQNTFKRFQIVPRREHHIVEHRRRNSLRIRKSRGILSRPQLLRRMAISVQTVRVVPAVIVAFELEEFCSSSVRARQPQGEHRGFSCRCW
jgi:hypothetical protein